MQIHENKHISKVCSTVFQNCIKLQTFLKVNYMQNIKICDIYAMYKISICKIVRYLCKIILIKEIILVEGKIITLIIDIRYSYKIIAI